MGDNIVLSFFLALIPLVVIHELGHFTMAKLGGMRVYTFSFGFGKKLFGFTYKGTEYRFNLLPLGGYVDLMGELVFNGVIPAAAQHFYNRPKWIRFLVLVMGPVFNMILAYLLYWTYHSMEPLRTPIYEGEPYTVGQLAEDAPELKAGLALGDRILTFQGKPVTDYDSLETEILLLPKKTVNLEVQRGQERLNLSYVVPADPKEGYGLRGFGPDVAVTVNSVVEGGPAAKAGLRPGDKLIAINGAEIRWSVRARVNEEITRLAPGPSEVTIERDGQRLNFAITPEQKGEADAETGKQGWLIGILMDYEHTRRDLSVLEAAGEAWTSFKRDSTVLFSAVKKLASGNLPLSMLAGPVGVARVANEALKLGFAQFILMVALLSLNLGIMNLLPIPVLDGGEILVILVEAITRREFSLETKFRIKNVGLIIILCLMAYVMTSDILKIF